MLTPTDIHYLVGFLTYVSSPDDVQIILGDRVQDSASVKERDVDITVTYKDSDGLISVFQGIEVKSHARPLDVAHVEQLVSKLRDMPDLNRRAIVSASGFTRPAERKAAVHGIDLFNLVDWTDTMKGFDHIKFVPSLRACQSIFTFSSPIEILFNPPRSATDCIQPSDDCRISVSAQENGECSVGDFKENLERLVLGWLHEDDIINKLSPGTGYPVSVKVGWKEPVYLTVDEERIVIHDVLVVGSLLKIESDLNPFFKILVTSGQENPYAGCLITEVLGGALLVLAIGKAERSFKWFPVTVSARNREKIQMLQLK